MRLPGMSRQSRGEDIREEPPFNVKDIPVKPPGPGAAKPDADVPKTETSAPKPPAPQSAARASGALQATPQGKAAERVAGHAPQATTQ